ncbi:hypothetical protein PTTG_05806 [Puccinia triticina 1-1 BBBD Race 1]|uniref:Uncharacterized protein n=1 Tax=Puccinia triticina (isolate 1-1 / race 1 (BBBD)) TaxID=630390 RepID=A0A180H2A1_PUCT1|nr:hypothetical protein PTTG_05806 [Puccinia triticina 1-1 BBBD Race 1]
MASTQPPTPAHPLRPYYQPSPRRAEHPPPTHWLRPPSTSPAPATLDGLLSPAPPGYLPARRASAVVPDYGLASLRPAPDPASLPVLLRAYLAAGLVAFTSTAIVMPFEVGKTLLQVQSIPAADHPLLLPNPSSLHPAPDDYLDEDEEDDSLDTYFTQVKPALRPSIGSTISKRTISGSTSATRTRGEGEPGTWPEWVLPVVVERGVGDMMRAISRWRGEGFLGLWKGQLTACVIDKVSSKLQPVLLSALCLLSSSPSAATLPLEHQAYPGLPLALSVGSYLATGLLLAPLDLVRTRLIVQSAQLRHRTYSGPLDALKTIIRDEGGVRALFLHPSLFLPALLDNLLRPLLHLATPLIVDRYFGLDRAHDPLRFALAEFALNSAALVLLTPLEIVRKRLQVQLRHPPSSAPPSPMKACVRLRPTPYNGIVDTIYRIISEEKHGFWALFRGFNVGLTANIAVFLLTSLANGPFGVNSNGNSLSSSGWAEV